MIPGIVRMFGENKENENGQQLWPFATFNSLKITNMEGNHKKNI